MRTVVLVIYIAVAAWTAFSRADGAWFVLHAVGAIAGLCALGQALSLASQRGELDHELYGPDGPDQAELDMREEDC